MSYIVLRSIDQKRVPKYCSFLAEQIKLEHLIDQVTTDGSRIYRLEGCHDSIAHLQRPSLLTSLTLYTLGVCRGFIYSLAIAEHLGIVNG